MATAKNSVLVVDDDKNIRNTLSVSLRTLGWEADVCDAVSPAVEKLRKRPYDLVLTDFRMEKETGLDLIRKAKELRPETHLVVMTAFASYENAVSVIREGAWDYLPKPFTTPQLQHLLERLGSFLRLKRENEELRKYRHRRDYFAGMTSQAMTRLEEFVRKVAPTDSTILITGESGTGKSELANLIHELSGRKGKPFVSVYCTTIVESLIESELFGHVAGAFTGASADKAGKFEMADGGTLFLDEIGDVSPVAQTKLLRFLQDRVIERVGSNRPIEVDTRIIAATNRNLTEAVKEGKFREDLYFRVNMFECHLVSLRHRREDLPILIQKFLEEARITTRRETPVVIPDDVMKRLTQYPWPGNLRELRNTIERLTVLATQRPASLDDLPEAIRNHRGGDGVATDAETLSSLEEVEREHIRKVLEREKNLERAAQVLGINSVTLWRKRKEYGLP